MALIYIVEDDQNIREIQRFALQNSGYQVEEFACARDFYRQIRKRTPDCVLLDIMLPDEDGLEILEKLRADPEMRRVPVMMVTARTTELDKVKGLDIGADDYMTKPFAIEELLARIRAALKRNSRIEESALKSVQSQSREFLKEGKLSVNLAAYSVEYDGEEISLTKKEFELLAYLLRHKGEAVTRDRLLTEVWEYEYMGDTNVVDVYIRYLRQKIDDRFQIKLITTVRGVGYMIR